MTAAELGAAIKAILPFLLPTVALVSSIAAVWFARRAHVLKHGLRIRGDFTITSTVDCDDQFANNVVLENVKDRAVVIFGIYLRVGVSHWIVLEEFGDAPQILRPFEAWSKEYGPIEHYVASGDRRVTMNRLLLPDLSRAEQYGTGSVGGIRK
jgi:hypothetical protein